MKRHIVVIEEDNWPAIDIQGFVDSLDDGAQIYAFQGRAFFLKTTYSAAEISKRLHKIDSGLIFFVADITKSDASGRMIGRFWEYMKEDRPALQDAAE